MTVGTCSWKPRWTQQLLGPIADLGGIDHVLLTHRDDVADADRYGFPVPGHTRGSVLWHVDGHLLFSGDSLAWSPRRERLTAFRDACWYSWDEQTTSLDRFARSGHRFDRLFCGHGWSHDAPADVFHDHLIDLVARMPDRR